MISDEEERRPCTVTAVMPAYNEERRIGDTIRSVAPYVDTVLVVDDASTDATAQRAREAGATVLSQPSNQGYIAAIQRGFSVADTDVVVTIDADGELPADRIPALIGPICTGDADMVQGARDRIVRPSERVLTGLARWGGPVGDSGTGFRALPTDLAQTLELRGACICGIFALEVLTRGGRITEIPITLRDVDKPRGVAWYHGRQFFYVVAALVRRSVSR